MSGETTTVRHIDIRPTVGDMKRYLAVIARDPDDETVLWGIRMAAACGEGWLEWYGGEVAVARGWKD